MTGARGFVLLAKQIVLICLPTFYNTKNLSGNQSDLFHSIPNLQQEEKRREEKT